MNCLEATENRHVTKLCTAHKYSVTVTVTVTLLVHSFTLFLKAHSYSEVRQRYGFIAT
jgi:hypothetical protein